MGTGGEGLSGSRPQSCRGCRGRGPQAAAALALWVALGAAVRAVETALVCPRAGVPIAVDGRLDEPEWAGATPLGGLTALGSLAPPQDRVEARVQCARGAVFLGVFCAAPEGVSTPAAGVRDDGEVWKHDRLEIFLDATPDSPDSFHLVLDRAGNRLDARLAGGGSPGDLRWDGDWEAAVAAVPGGWSAEIVLPLAMVGVPDPQPGDLCLLKLCRDGGRDGPLAWPPNPGTSFHLRGVEGCLYLEAMDLLSGADFDTGEVRDGAPLPWRPALTSPEVNNAPQGTVETLADAGPHGGRAVRLTKLATALWWPQLWSSAFRLRPGAAYEFSVMAQGTLPSVNLRATAAVGDQAVKMSQGCPVPAAWERLRFVFTVPEGASGVALGLSAPAGIAGEALFAEPRLRRVRAPAGAAAAPGPLSTEPDPDPVQGLDAFQERQGHKPWDLYEQDGELKTLRVIFRDRRYGTPVWMLDNSPTVDHSNTASIWSPWNPTGSALFVEGARILGGQPVRGWFLNADFSRLRPARGGQPAVWSPEEPDTYYSPASPVDRVLSTHWRTGEQHIVAQWEALSWPGSGQRLYGLTRDRRHLFIDLPNRGIFVPFTDDPGHPIPALPLYDGRPIGPGGEPIGFNHVPVVYKHPQHGDLIALRTGMLIDRQTGEKTCIAAPLCGNTNYLRAFQEGRVRYPEGDQWKAYGLPWFAAGVRLPVGLSIEELRRLWLNLPHATHGHESPSPDWEYIATDGGAVRFVRVRDGETRSVQVSPNGGNYHLHWDKHPRFLVSWVRGWQFGSYLRPQYANTEFQVFVDGTSQPIVDTKHRLNGYYSGGDFAILSPDATKIHYASSMTGRFRNYVAVVARPRPPAGLSWSAGEGVVVVRWQPPARSREIRGYLVYRSERSGDGYVLLTPEPVASTEYRDTGAAPGVPYYYVVTSLEHCGLESIPSAEAVVAGAGLAAGAGGPCVVYAEAEEAVRDLPTDARPGLAFGVDRKAASDWGFLYRHPESAGGSAEVGVVIPVAGRYRLWARVRSARAGIATWAVTVGGRPLEVRSVEESWVWVKAAGDPVLDLAAGPAAVRLSTTDQDAQMDLLCLAAAGGFVPSGPRPEKTAPPPAVTNLRAENIRPRVNRLLWDRCPDPAFSHYAVYAGSGPDVKAAQEYLVGSPTEPEFIDWGLRPGVAYHYLVCAVDRAGNESAPAAARAATPAAPEPVHILLACGDAERTGPFETAAGEGTLGAVYVVARDPAASALSWTVEIPRSGEYYLWLRYLHRGSGDRGGEVQQALRVRVDDQAVCTDLGGGLTDLSIPDRFLAPGNPLAPRLWTWARPGGVDLQRTVLPAGRHRLVLDRLTAEIRYDALAITDDPAWVPSDGRLRQR